MEYLGTNKPINRIQPIVSVCIPTYNHERYIKDCLDGILMQQTDFPFEIIIGEDESTDNTRRICIEYAERHPDKIRLFLRNREDVIYVSGIPTGKFNFIQNMRATRGAYVALCDGDDRWIDSKKLQKQVDLLINNKNYVLSYHDTRLVDEYDNIISQSLFPDNEKKDKTSVEIMSGKYMHTSTVMFRNGLITKFPPEYFKVFNGDAFIFTLLAHHGNAKYHSDIIPNYYRIHPGGVWTPLKRYNRLKHNINTWQQLSTVVDSKYEWVIRRNLLINNLFLVAFCEGFYPRLKQYIFAYKYFKFDKRFIMKFINAHIYLSNMLLLKVRNSWKANENSVKR